VKTSTYVKQGIRGLSLLLALCSRFASAYTAPPAAPASSATGSYSVSWSAQCTGDCFSLWLEERVGSGSFVWVGSGSPKTFSGKPAGQYSYRLARMVSSYAMPYYAMDYSTEVTVNVGGSLPPLDPLLTQRNYRYQTRVGDVDYDGRRDLYIQRVSGGVANNGILDKIIVQQTATPGQYLLVPPSAAQAAAAATWPASSAQVAVEDINVDGFVDVTVKGVAGALGVPGAANLIVYSPGAPFAAAPKGVRAVDTGLLQFVGNMLDYEVDQNYFVNNAPYVYYTLYYSWSTCGGAGIVSSDGYWGADPGCGTVYQYLSGYYQDYSVFSSAAVAISDSAASGANGQTSATAAVDAIDRTAEGVFKTTIGGWGMEEVLGSTGEHTNPDARRALEVFWAILGAARADAEEVQTTKAPRQTSRVFGTVYVTGHHVFGLGPIHTAIEYTSVALPTTTLSAGPEGTLPYLVSRPNRPSDNSALNMVLGTVNDPQSPSAEAFFAELSLADANYDDDLRYALFPVASGAYNSNSYVRGLIEATGGVTTVNLALLVGGDKPVPASKFY
jgi:hypothetical protein